MIFLRRLIIALALLIAGLPLYSQGFYSSSNSAHEIYGVRIEGGQSNENRNAITSIKDSKYVSDHLSWFKNITMIHTEKMEFKGKVWYVWMIDYKMGGADNGEAYMTDYLALTEAQNESLKMASSSVVSLVHIPHYCTMSMVREWEEDELINNIRTAILEKDDFKAITFCITAKKLGENILFNYDVDCWTYSGSKSNRTYEKLDLVDNLDGGYFRIPHKQWENLFLR